MLEALYVFEIPMSLPIDARVPDERVKEAKRVLARAKEVGEEYEGVEVATAMVRGRTVGQAIVSEARRRGVEAIVLAAEEPSAPARRRDPGGPRPGARPLRGRDHPLRGREGPLHGDPHRAARGRGGHPRGRPALATPGLRLARLAPGQMYCGTDMFVLIVGCGRVGSAIANSMLEEGHEVSVLDEDAEAIALLDRGQAESWEERGGRSPRAPRSRSTPCSPPASSRRTPSSPPPTATTPTS